MSRFAIANNPKMMANFERFEAEISHWVHPIAEAQPKTWMDALKNYRRDQQQAFFSPERIILYLDPLNEDEPFAPGAEWEREIFIHGWQNNEEINVPLEQLLLTREFEGDSWFKKTAG
ncbi:hypothetical protein QS257_16145 [Terrilactibacillus sp. S3-3]|nr:hypothetical protein QS257_16145 [Terrilactibacillus sp. S3-3]